MLDYRAWIAAALILIAGASAYLIWIYRPKATYNAQSLSAAPGNLSAVGVAPTQVNLAWVNNATNQTGFKIERSGDAGQTWAQNGSISPHSNANNPTRAASGG